MSLATEPARASAAGGDLTALLTHSRADRVVELRGLDGTTPHVYLDEEVLGGEPGSSRLRTDDGPDD